MPRKAERLSDVPTTYLVCRGLNHPWDETTIVDRITARTVDGQPIEIRRTIQCGRCKTPRVSIIDFRTFKTKSSRYDYPDDYLVQWGDDNTLGMPLNASVAIGELFKRQHWKAR